MPHSFPKTQKVKTSTVRAPDSHTPKPPAAAERRVRGPGARGPMDSDGFRVNFPVHRPLADPKNCSPVATPKVLLSPCLPSDKEVVA